MQNKYPASETRPPRKYYSVRKKFCTFCKEKITLIDYKNSKILENFISDTGKIFPARLTGTCSYHQKQMSKAIKRARHMALIRYSEE